MEHLRTSQQLVGLQKLTLKDIAPMWFAKLTGKYDDIEGRLVVTDDEKCIAGEAHGFNSDYLTGETPCGECFDLAFGLVGVAQRYNEFPATEEELNNDTTIKQFVNHWNEFHITH